MSASALTGRTNSRTLSMSIDSSSSTSTVAPSNCSSVSIGASGEREAPGERARVADDLDDVRRLEQVAVELDAAHGLVERALRHHPVLVVELDGLRVGGAHLLHDVQQGPHAHRAGTLLDGDPDARARDRHQAGEDVEGAGSLLGLGQRGLAAGVLGLELVARLLETVPLAARALGGAGEGVEDLDEVLLAQPRVGVVLLGVAHLHDGREAEHREQDGDHDLGAGPVAQGGRQPLATRVLVVRARARLVAGLRLLRHGRGGAGWRRRWRRCGCRGPRPPRSTAGCRHRACRPCRRWRRR